MAAPLECPEIECWQALHAGDLPPDQVGQWERHLESCPSCQDRLDRGLEGEEEIRRWASRVGDPTSTPVDPTLTRFLERMHEGYSLAPDTVVEPPDLYFLSPSSRPDILGILGTYEVRKVIGQGGMGVVLEAYEPALHRLVAIKVLAAAVAGSATARRRFTREAKAAAAVCHEHIVAVHGVHEIDGLPYLVMQYVAGESLQERLDRTGPLEVEEVVRLGLQVATGLAAAHTQGLIHRDIKPANLLLAGERSCRGDEPELTVKITDFGLARMVDDVQVTQAGVVAGTPEYMAPEQARGEQADHRSDLFSLGSVLYACCAGRAPFQGASPLALLRAVNEHDPVPLRLLDPGVPAWLESLISGLMAKDPGLRFQSAEDVAVLLKGYLAHLRQPALSPAPALPPVADADSTGPRADQKKSLRPPNRVARRLFAKLAGLGGASALLLVGMAILMQGAAQEGNGNNVAPDPYVVWSVAVSPDGKVVAAGAGWWTTGGEVGVWDLATFKPLRRFAEERGVLSVAFSPDSKLLASGIWTGHVRVLDWAASKEVADFTTDGVAHVAFARDSSLLATASEGATLQFWDVANGKLMADLEGDLVRFHRLTFSPNGKRVLACGGDWKQGGTNHLGVWDVASKKQVSKLVGHTNTVFCLACSPDGKLIATGSVDRTIRLWDAETGGHLKTLRGPMRSVDCLAFTANGKTLLSCGHEPAIRIWDVEMGVETGTLDTGIHHVRALHLMPDDKTLIAGGQEKTLKVFDLESRRQVAVLWSGVDQQVMDMDALPASTPEAAEEARSYANVKILGLGLALAVPFGLVVWLLVRRGRAARRRPEQPPPAAPRADERPEEPRIAFACAACGAKLKAKGTLAGKKVKCSRCAEPVSVPSLQVGEPG